MKEKATGNRLNANRTIGAIIIGINQCSQAISSEDLCAYISKCVFISLLALHSDKGYYNIPTPFLSIPTKFSLMQNKGKNTKKQGLEDSIASIYRDCF